MQAITALEHFSVFVSRQRWLPYKTRRSLVKRLYPRMLRDFSFETAFYNPAWGLRYYGNLTHAADRRVYFYGAQQKHILCFMHEVVTRSYANSFDAFACIDVGAGGGNFSLFLSKIATQIYAFEPCARERSQLEYNLSLNRIHNVAVYPFALGESNALQALCNVQQSSSEGWHLEHWQVRTGDSALAEVNAAPVQLVRIEAEGQETAVLAGLAETLKRCRPLVLCTMFAAARQEENSQHMLQNRFPEHYRFYAFAVINARHGSYRLVPVGGDELSRYHDIIACPAEKLALLGI